MLIWLAEMKYSKKKKESLALKVTLKEDCCGSLNKFNSHPQITEQKSLRAQASLKLPDSGYVTRMIFA